MTGSDDGEGERQYFGRLGLNRRSVLRAVGLSGIGAATAGSAGGTATAVDTESTDDTSTTERIPTSSQLYTFTTLTAPGPSNTDAKRLALDPKYDSSDYQRDAEGYSNADLIYRSAEAGLDAYEPNTIDDAEEMLAAQQETGCYMSSAHVGIDSVESDPAGTAETYAQFAHDGCNPPIIAPSIGEDQWQSAADAEQNAKRVNEIADAMAGQGFKFGYHNHYWEFAYAEDGETRLYDIFLDHVDDHVYLELDVAWVYAGVDRPDPVEYITQHGDKFGLLHMKNWTEDRGDGLQAQAQRELDAVVESAPVENPAESNLAAKIKQLTEIHRGDLEMRAIADAAKEHADIDHFVYEYDATPHPDHSFEYASLTLDKVNLPK